MGVFDVQFALTTEQENRNLGLETLSFVKNMMKRGVNVQYTEDISKTKNGGCVVCVSKGKLFMDKKNLTNAERRPVELYKK